MKTHPFLFRVHLGEVHANSYHFLFLWSKQNHACTLGPATSLASFPGPAQLSVAYS